MTTALIIGNGTLPDIRQVDFYMAKSDMIICADGGANFAYQQAILPSYIIGDLDSIFSSALSFFNAKSIPIIHDDSQHTTDIEKALNFALFKKITHVFLVGLHSESRIDHTLYNLHLLFQYAKKLAIEVGYGKARGFFIYAFSRPTSVSFSAMPGQVISLFAFHSAEGVSTEGLKYPLHHASLSFGSRESISNEVIGHQVTIMLERGIVWVCQNFS